MDIGFEQLANAEIARTLLSERGIVTPTPVQREAIALMRAGKDVIARSDTGTGKTLAYLIPVFMKIDGTQNNLQAIVLTPTKELAAQVCAEANRLFAGLRGSPPLGGDPPRGARAKARAPLLKAAAILGGVNINRQIEALKEKPQIIAGQATRIIELITRKKLSVHYCKTIVLDEADKLYENGFDDITALINKTQKDRQLAMFSASLPMGVKNAGLSLMNDPVLVNATEKASIPPHLRHTFITAAQRDKIKILRRILHESKDKALIFVNNPYTIEDVANRLNYHGVKARALHGGANGQNRRESVTAFKTGAARALVASDVAARGLDIEGLTLIVNLDAPSVPRDYQHRAGRAGRAGEPSLVVTIVTEYERRFIKTYEKAFSIEINEGVLN